MSDPKRDTNTNATDTTTEGLLYVGDGGGDENNEIEWALYWHSSGLAFEGDDLSTALYPLDPQSLPEWEIACVQINLLLAERGES